MSPRLARGVAYAGPARLGWGPTHASIVLPPTTIASIDMDTRSRTPLGQALRLSLVPLLAGALLLPECTHGQSIPPQSPPEGPEGPQPGDARSPGEEWGPEEECEDHDEDGDCDPIHDALGIVFAEYLPSLTDGVQVGYGRAPGGTVYGGRLEWTLRRSQGRRLMLGAGTWIAPTGMLRPESDESPLRYTGHDGAFALTLGGSLPPEDLGLPARRSVRGIAEATVLVGDPGRQLRLSVGPRYRVALNRRDLTVDLVVGTNLSTESFAPRVGLRIGWIWD